MNPSQERKYLQRVVNLLEKGTPKYLQSFWVDLGLWLMLFALFTIMLLLRERIPYMVSAAIFMLAGSLLGSFFVSQAASKHWPLLRPHVDKESVVQRIEELDS